MDNAFKDNAMEKQRLKNQLALFGRVFSLLLNRCLMYHPAHPVIKQSAANVQKAAARILDNMSPFVFILDRGKFFIDEEPLDPRINASRVAALFKRCGIQSVSFEQGLAESELLAFCELFADMTRASDVESIRNSLKLKGVFSIRINHVIYKKVTEDDQVLSRDALEKITPLLDAEDDLNRKRFMEALLESVLSEEFAKTLNITNLMANPSAFSSKMIEIDLAGASGPESEPKAGAPGYGKDVSPDGSTDEDAAPGHGPLLLHQLELIQDEVQKHLHGQGDISISDLAQAIFDMKKQLLEGIQAQKVLGIAYANEAAIVQTANHLADQVLVELVKEEYQAGKISTQRLAHLIRRMIPEPPELRRLLPQIKRALLDEGMPMTEYLGLIHELRNELQSDALARILEESSAAIGLDGRDLIEEVKRNPGQAAELIYLASEIRKGGGDDSVLSDILVEYVEQLGSQMARDTSTTGSLDGEGDLKQAMADIESQILKKLGQMNVNADVLTQMEARINERMESILNNMRVQWLQTQVGHRPSEKPRTLTVLQTLEQNIGEDEEMATILKTVRAKVESGEIEENNFSQIHKEVARQKELLREHASGKTMAEGILSADDTLFILEKEIARARRYGSYFSVLALAFVSASPQMKALEEALTHEAVRDAALGKISSNFREVDYIGRIDKNKIMILLPMIDELDAKKALERVLRLLHANPLDVGGVPVQLRVAGVASGHDAEQAPNAQLFARQLARQLAVMVERLKNIQVLF